MDNRKIPDSERVDIGDYIGQEINSETLETIAEKQVMVVMGGGKGDEGKGGDAYMLASKIDYDLIVSPGGGPNAGHEVYREDGAEFIGHNLPGAAMTGKDVFLGQGKHINVAGLLKEIEELRALGVNPKIKIARGANCLFDSIHGKLDGSIEDFKSQSGDNVGTTRVGVGPGAATKALRSSFNIGQLNNATEEKMDTQIDQLIYPFKEELVGTKDDISAEVQSHQETLNYLIGNGIIEIVDDDYAKIRYNQGCKMLVECAQSPSLGMFGGAYPNNTSNDMSFGGVMSSLLIEPTPDKVGKYIVAKLFPSAVGEHDFPEQISKILEGYIEQEKRYALENGEKGKTSDRLRMVGLPSPRLIAEEAESPYTTAIAIRKLDMLGKVRDILETKMLPVVTDYQEDGTCDIEEIEYTYKAVASMYRDMLIHVLGEEKGKSMPMIFGYGPKPNDSRIDLGVEA